MLSECGKKYDRLMANADAQGDRGAGVSDREVILFEHHCPPLAAARAR
jgi:hypothetical protein